MGVRDKEIKRLIKYAQGLNIKVSFRPRSAINRDAAEWTTDGKAIRIFKKKDSSKLHIILCLIHELGHALEFIHNENRVINRKLDEAVMAEEERKIFRRRIYEWEVKSAHWWISIYKEVDLKFPLHRLYREKDLDLWMYEHYYEYGTYPNGKQIINKKKDLKLKHKKNGE